MNEELIAALVGVIKVKGLKEATRDINQFTRDTRKMAKAVAQQMGVADKAVKQHQKTFRTMVQDNAAQIRTAGRYLTVFGAALTGVVVKAGKEFIEFQRDAANVSTMLSGTISEVSGQMAVYSSGIKDLSIEFDQSTTTLQKGLYNILSASVAPAQALEVLKVSAEAATAGISTVAVAADAITTILNAYAMEAESAADVSDKLWAIVRRGKITFDEVASSIGAVATTAAMAGLSYKELGAGIATATRAGVEHRRAMTGINAVLLTFLKNTDEQREAAAKFGIELSSLALKSEGLIGVVQKLAGANELGRRATAEEIVAIFENRRALTALLPILQDVTGYQEDLALMTDSAGLSALAFSKISQTLDFQLGQLGKTLKVMLIEYFEPLVPVIEKIVSIIKSLADTFRDLSPTLKAAISTITLLSGVFMTLGGVILMLAPGIGALAATIGGPALLAVGALAAALIGGGGLVAALVQASSAVRFADQAVSEHIAKMKEARVTYETEQKTMDRLISKYKELRAAVDATTPGTEERRKAEEKLQQVVREIVNIVPEAAVAWDKYGKVIDVNIKTVERSAEIHRQLYDIKQQLRLRDLAEEAVNLRKQQQNRDKEIENIRQQIERERGYLEFLAQERERLLNQKGGDDFMAGPQKSVEEFDASWNNMAGTMAGALSPSLEEIEQGFVNTSASISKWTEKLLALNQESLSYNLTVKEMAVHLVDLAERGKISDTELNHLLDTVPKLKDEFDALKSEGVKPVDDSLKTLIFTMADVRNTYATWQDYVDFVTKSAAPATKTWEEELNGLTAEVDAAAEALKRMYESGEEFDLDVRLEAEERLIAAINKRAEASKKAAEEEEKAIKELSDDYLDLMRDFQAFQEANTRTTLVEIKKRQAMYEQDADEWKAWEKVKVKYTQARAAEITAIWEKMREEMSNAIEGGIQDLMLGKKGMSDIFADLGDSFAESMSKAFTERISHALDFESMLAGPWGMAISGAFAITQMGAEGVQEILDGLVQSIKDLPEMIKELVNAIPEIIQVIVESIPEIITALIEAIPQIIEAVLEAIPVIIQTICEYIPVIIQTILEKIPDIIQMVVEMIPMIIQQIVEMIPVIITAVVEMIPEIISALIETIPEIIGAVIEAVPQIIGAVIEGIPEIIGALIEGIPEIIGAVIEAIPDIAEALVKAIFSLIGGKSGLGIGFDIFKDMFGGIGDIFGDIFGGIGGFFEDIFGGFGHHGTSGLEEHMMALEKLAKGETTAGEVIGQMRQYTTGRTGVMSSVDPDAHGAELEHLLTDSFEKRQEWFDKYVEQTGLFSEAELDEVRDLLGLWEDETEVAAGKVREAYRTAYQDLGEAMRWVGDDLKDAATGWQDAFSVAWDRAADGSIALTTAYRDELGKIPGMGEETINELVAVLQKAGVEFEELGEAFGVPIEMGLSYISEASYAALKAAGVSISDFGDQVDEVMNRVAGGPIVDFKAALMEIPGMTEEVAYEIMESFGIIEEKFDELDKALYGNGESWDEWYDGIAVALNMAGTDMNTFGNATSATINKFLKGGMDDLRSALLEIPGMTEDMADQFVADAEKMKEAGETDFSFSDEQIKKAEESMAKMDEIIADSGGIEQWRENWGEAFSELDISGLSDKAAEAGDKFERSFSGILRGMDIAGSIDTSEAEQRMREAGYDAGREYKAGFEEGASGSGILGDVMWDEDVISLAVSRFTEAGKELGAAMKEGFSLEEEGMLSGIEKDLDGLARVAVPSFPVIGVDQRGDLELPARGGRIMEVERVLEREGGVSNNATTTNYFSITVQAPSGSPNDTEYWRRLSREKIIPAFKEELAREGKKLGG